LRDFIDLSSPSGILLFQLIAAMSQFERSLIQERVRADFSMQSGKARDWGGVPSKSISSGASWRMISKELGISVGKVHKAFRQRS
jgi:DNA invertase Pin-like site-specific DNA recombinase